MLLLRRAGAFSVDSAFLITAMVVGATLGAIGLIDLGEQWDAPMLFIAISYFGVLDGYSDGTIGKRVFRLSLHDTNGRDVGPFRAFLRATIFFVLPLILYLLVQFGCWLFRLSMPFDSFLAIPTLAFSMVLLPVSVTLSGGRNGLHDLVAGVELVERHRSRSPGKRPGMKQVAISSVLVSQAVFVFLAWPLRSTRPEVLRGGPTPFGTTDTLTDAMSKINGAGLFFADSVMALDFRAGINDSMPTFLNSPFRDQLEPDVAKGRRRFPARRTIVVAVSREGLFSTDFHSTFAHMALELLSPSRELLITFEFEWTGDFGFVRVLRSKRWVAVPSREVGGFKVIEPDESVHQSLALCVRYPEMGSLQFGLGGTGF